MKGNSRGKSRGISGVLERGALNPSRSHPLRTGGAILAVAFAACLTSVFILSNAPLRAQQPDYTGEDLYLEYCTFCHGPDGAGSVLGANFLAPLVIRKSDRELRITLNEGRPDKGMPPFGQGFSSEEIDKVLTHVRQLQGVARRSGTTGSRQNKEPEQVDSASVARGEELFRAKAGCFDCHSIYNMGGVTGPNLMKVASRLTSTEIYQSIAFPDQRIDKGFRAKTIVTRDGKTIVGRHRRETDGTIQLLNAEGNLWTTYFKEDLKSIGGEEISLMPRGLLKKLTPEEVRDLFAFLNELK